MNGIVRCLDLYCGGGGASKGYADAGFKVVGVDNEPQLKYPYKFILADALEIAADIKFLQRFDLIHASPVCKKFSTITRTAGTQNEWPNDIPEIRQLLKKSGKPFVIENVPGAPLENYVVLCGTMFGLNVERHRLFECHPAIWFSPAVCNHHKKVAKHGRPPNREKEFAAVTGHFSDVEFAKQSMEISWLGQAGLAKAIPPAYTQWIGLQMLKIIGGSPYNKRLQPELF